MPNDKPDLLQGTVDLLVLRVLHAGPRHGYDIAKRIQLLSKEIIKVGQGSLYPSLHRLERQGYIKANWGQSNTGRRAKFYELTKDGKAHASQEQRNWIELTSAVNFVLDLG